MPAPLRLLSRLPLRVAHGVGALLGLAVFAMSGKTRRLLRDNLTQAYPKAGLSMRLAAAAHMGRGMTELGHVWLGDLDDARALIADVVGDEHLAAALARGGVMVLTPHLGCFEALAMYLGTRAPLTALYSPHKRDSMEELIQSGRGRHMRLAPAGRKGVRQLLTALKCGELVLVLPDQVPRVGDGRWTAFFGRYAYTMTLAARLSEVGGTSVLMAYARRLSKGRGFRVHIEPPKEPIEGDTEARTLAVNRNIESLIRQCPTQYLWAYYRYKAPSGAEPPPAP